MNQNWIPEGEAGMNQNKIEIDPAILDGISAALKKMWEEIDRAKQAKPEPVEFWEGQLITSADGRVFVFDRLNGNETHCVSNRGMPVPIEDCRPLQDPLIDQYKPLAVGELCPLKDGVIKIKSSNGHVSTVVAAWFNLHRNASFKDVIGWMPADGWGV